MKTLLTIIVTLFVSTLALAGPPIIFNGNFAKTLKTNLNLFDAAYLLTGTVDPSSVATNAPAGSLYMNTSTGAVYAKLDAGSTTNWKNILTVGTGWTLTGNAGTNPATNFIGTTDAQDFVIRTNNVERFRITSAGVYDTTFGLGILHSDASGLLSSSAVNLASADVTGVLPIANGGTNFNATGGANDILGVNAANTAYEFKSLSGTANRLSVTNGVGSYTLNVDTTLLPSPLAGDANKSLIATGANASAWSLIVDANVAASGTANIARNKLAAGTANYVLVNNGSGYPSELGNITTSKLFLTQTGTGAAANAASFGSISASDLPLTNGHVYVGNVSNQAADVAMSGDVTISNAGVTAIGVNKVTNSQLAQMPANTIKGNNTAGLANAADLTVAQTNTMLGDVTALAAVGAVPNANGASISGNTLNLQPFDLTHPGVVTAGGSASNVLHGDGSWSAVAAGIDEGITPVWSADSNSVPEAAPDEVTVVGQKAYAFLAGGSQVIETVIKVPSGYVAGAQIKMKTSFPTGASTLTDFLKATSYLIRKNTDALTSTTNSHASVNTAVTSTGLNVVIETSIDLTDNTGKINAVAVSPGDLIRVQLTRGTDTDTADLNFIPTMTEVLFK